jgi:hypothetical protein
VVRKKRGDGGSQGIEANTTAVARSPREHAGLDERLKA